MSQDPRAVYGNPYRFVDDDDVHTDPPAQPKSSTDADHDACDSHMHDHDVYEVTIPGKDVAVVATVVSSDNGFYFIYPHRYGCAVTVSVDRFHHTDYRKVRTSEGKWL